jgi:hypothetical protein
MGGNFAFLAQGKLHVKLGDAPVSEVDSRFGEQVRERALQIQERNAWKTQGTGARFMSGGVLWGRQGRDPAEARVAITGLSAGCNPGELLYSLETSDIGGVFLLRNEAKDEQRLLHTSDFRVRRLAASGGHDRVACVIGQKGGNTCIAVMHGDGADLREVTQGDTVDDAPRWVPGSDRELVFQSSAIGRNQAGFAIAQGPFTIQKLDLDAGEVTTLIEDPKADLLAPYLAKDGTLFYIRRPYRDPNQRPGWLHGVLDLILLPFRLLYAVFQFLNFFTVRYTGNTLTNAGDMRRKQADIRQMMIWGNMIDAEKAAREGDREEAALVPKTWELIRQSGNQRNVVAKGALSFDIGSDGAVIYSNGSAIYCVAPDGKTERLAQAALIEQVVAL